MCHPTCPTLEHPPAYLRGWQSRRPRREDDRSLESDTIVDYRNGDDAVVRGIQEALNGQKLYHEFDAVSDNGSWLNLTKVLNQSDAQIAVVLRPQDDLAGRHGDIPAEIYQSLTSVWDVCGPLHELGYLCCKCFTKGLREGWFKAQPQEIIAGGLEGIEGALEKLQDGSAIAVKCVVRIGETPGVDSVR